MIVCQRCGKENQDHYKFCLGCGAEIAPAGGDSVGMMKTMMADMGSAPNLPGMPAPAPSGPPPGVGLPQQPLAQPAPAPQPMQSAPQPVAAPMPQPYPQQPAPILAPQGQELAPPSMGPGPQGSARGCRQCSADIPPNFMFCGVCGTPVQDAAPASAPAAQQPPPAVAPAFQASMTLIRPDGSEGGTFSLQMGSNIVGREHGEIFSTDGYLSPTHAEIEIRPDGQHVLRDQGSLNGVFVRMTEEEELTPGQIIRIGQELLRFERIDPPPNAPDGTEVMGSPSPGYWGRITVIIGDDVTGAAYPLLGDSITMGREHGDINFPEDGYVSGMHARLVARDSRVFLSDMGSSNGTFMKVAGERTIVNGSFILLGQQLFRVAA